MEIILVGACGKMGREVARGLFDGMHIAASVDLRSHCKNISDYRGEADVIIDFSSHTATEETYTIDKNTFASKGRNTPFDGKTVTGRVKYTICDGNVVYDGNN